MKNRLITGGPRSGQLVDASMTSSRASPETSTQAGTAGDRREQRALRVLVRLVFVALLNLLCKGK